MNNELEETWKEATHGHTRYNNRYFHGEIEENKNIGHDSQSPGRDMKPRFPEQEAEVLTTPSRRLHTKIQDKKVKVKLSLYQAMEAHMVMRR
jgi:hypothetical protein